MATKRPGKAVRTAGVVITTAAVVAGGLTAAGTAQAVPGSTSAKVARSAKDSAASKRAAAKLDAVKRIKAAQRSKAGSPAVPGRYGKGRASLPKKGSYSFLLTLDARSTVSVTRSSRSRSAARTAAREQRSTIAALQRRVAGDLPSGSKVLYRTHALTAGIAVRAGVTKLDELREIKGVTGVYPIAPKKLDNTYAVPHQGAPQAWQTYGDRGQNSSVAIIDTGIDYTHTDFGGPGTKAAFTTAGSAAQQTKPTVFPTEKVVGGYDFAGDAYNSDPTSGTYSPTPKPDENPLDCEGHGSHVAGTAAGFGVNADGSTYTGAYTTSTPFNSLKIGPGMAPQADLYAFRVFGCAGSTDLTGAALDRSIDPNDDGDTTDHVGVANLSLGSDFVPPGGDADTLLVKAATDAGVSVVAAAGNAGDVYDIAGTPANEPSAISVAASRDAQAVVDGLNVTAPAAAQYPAERSVAYDYAEDPDLQGNLAKLSAANKTGCDPLSTADKAAVNGKVAFLEWHDAAPECGSVKRSGNLVAAGAVGFVFGSDAEAFSAGITGSAKIPGVLVAKSGADTIRAQLGEGITVTVGSTAANGVKQQDTSLNEQVADFTSRGVRGADGLKPDVAAIGDTVFSAASGSGTEGVTESGTSMSTPMTAGLAALIRSEHSDLSPAQVKADIMNTAGQDLYAGPNETGDKYAPNRVGAGRIDAKAALDNGVLAYVTGTGIPAGVVSASFGPIEVTGDVTLQKTITVQNTSAHSGTFATGYSARTEIPGAVYSVTPSSVTVAPRSTATVTVTLAITRSLLSKTIDPTVSRSIPLDDDSLPRQYVADASGLVTLTPADDNTTGATTPLRVPVYSSPRPAAVMTQPSTIKFPAGAVAKTSASLSGTGVDQGDFDSGTGIASIASGFELQVASGRAPSCTATVTDRCVGVEAERSADLKYVGVTSSAPQLATTGENPLTSVNGLAYFAVTMQGAWRNPIGYQGLEIYIDSTGDNVADAVTYLDRLPNGVDSSDVMIAVTESLTDPDADPDVQFVNDSLGDTDTAVFDSDTIVLPVLLSALPGVSASKSRIRYSVISSSGSHIVDSVGSVDEKTNKLTAPRGFDVLRPGIAVYSEANDAYDGEESPLLYLDEPGRALTVRRENPVYASDAGQGVMFVHFHNKVGAKAQVVSIAQNPTAIGFGIRPNPTPRGKPVTATVKVAGQTGQTPTGSVVVRRYGPGTAVAVVGTASLSQGLATVKFTQFAPGSYTYRATYGGDKYNAVVVSAPQVLKVT